MSELWPGCRRGLEQTRGADSPDVTGSPLWIECKRGAKLNLWAAFDQARSDLKKSKSKKYIAPVVIARRDRDRQWLVTMAWDLFKSMWSGDDDMTNGKAIKDTIRKVIETHTAVILDIPPAIEETGLQRHRKSIDATVEACFAAVIEARTNGISGVMQQLHAQEAADHEMLDQAFELTEKGKW